MPKKLLSPEDARDFLVRRFNNQHQVWIAGGGSWPVSFSLGAPTEKDISDGPAAVRAWANAWHTRRGPGEVIFEERRFAKLGSHRLPVSLTLADAEEVAACVGQAKRWSAAVERYRQLVGVWPVLGEGAALASKFNVLADYSVDDFARLLSLLAWLQRNPNSNLYLRQLPVEGVDTKWLERRTGLVADLLRALRAQTLDDSIDFHELCGLRRPEHRVRVRLLCSSMRALIGGAGDIEAPVSELAQLPIEPRAVVIVENLETGLALPEMAGVAAVLRLGNAVSALAALPWVQNSAAVYWGDIDTHGFAILDRARRAVPKLRSVLMDQETLLAHRALWGHEPNQYSGPNLTELTAGERESFEHLKANTWGHAVRMEQERLSWEEAMNSLKRELATTMPGRRTHD